MHYHDSHYWDMQTLSYSIELADIVLEGWKGDLRVLWQAGMGPSCYDIASVTRISAAPYLQVPQGMSRGPRLLNYMYIHKSVHSCPSSYLPLSPFPYLF
jgi:hypothetical protein